jgi:hypothetical protein
MKYHYNYTGNNVKNPLKLLFQFRTKAGQPERMAGCPEGLY